MVDLTPFLPGLSPVQGKAVVARSDGGRLSSEGGLLALREIERRLGLADRLANCLVDPRAPERVVHRLAEIIRFRMLMIAAGYEDGNDADALRRDPNDSTFTDVNAGFPPISPIPRPGREKALRGMSATSARHRAERLHCAESGHPRRSRSNWRVRPIAADNHRRRESAAAPSASFDSGIPNLASLFGTNEWLLARLLIS
jgi:hypothetical protein